MWALLTTTDRAVAHTRPAWGWIAEVALIWIGCHLVADRLDDALLAVLTSVGIAWPAPEWPIVGATWAAVALELGVGVTAIWLRMRGDPTPIGPREWLRRLHPGSVADATFVAATTVAGAWALAMGAEDACSTTWPDAARPVGAAVAALVVWRIAWPATRSVLQSTPVPRRRVDGLLRALVLAPFAAFAVRHGWPVWGWL